MNAVCGLPDGAEKKGDATNGDSFEDRMKMLQEAPFWRTFLNVNAVVGLTTVVFLFGFYH